MVLIVGKYEFHQGIKNKLMDTRGALDHNKNCFSVLNHLSCKIYHFTQPIQINNTSDLLYKHFRNELHVIFLHFDHSCFICSIVGVSIF